MESHGWRGLYEDTHKVVSWYRKRISISLKDLVPTMWSRCIVRKMLDLR